MLEHIKKNKKIWIMAAVILAVVVGVIVISFVSCNSEPTDNSKVDFEVEEDGLEVEEDDVVPDAGIDVSGSWDDNDSQPAGSGDTVDDKNNSETNEKNEPEANVSEGKILEGNSWTEPR